MRPMFVWRDARGALIADVVQVAKVTLAGPRAVYVARVAGQQVEKPRFSCARRVIEDWLRVNKIQATAHAS